MVIYSIGKEARKELKEGLKHITGIEIKTKKIKGYIEPRDCEVVFNQGILEEKLQAIKQVKEFLTIFRNNCFEKGI